MLAQLDGADESEDQPDEDADEGDDGQGLNAAFLDEDQQVPAPEAGAAAEHPAAGHRCLADEGKDLCRAFS